MLHIASGAITADATTACGMYRCLERESAGIVGRSDRVFQSKIDIVRELAKDKVCAEDWILLYSKRKKEYFEDERYLRESLPSPHDVGSRGGKGTSYTEYKIIHLADIERSEKWLLAVELMEKTLSPKRLIFLECRREALKYKGKRNWILFVQRTYAERLAKMYGRRPENFWVSYQTICNWWNKIIDMTLHIAYHTGCEF